MDRASESSIPLPSSSVQVALQWDFGRNGIVLDLDCSAVAFDGVGGIVDAVYFNQTSALDGAMRHTGDQRDGRLCEGDDECIDLDLALAQSRSVAAIALIVTCAVDEDETKEDFRAINTASLRLRNTQNNGEEIHRAVIPSGTRHSACILGVFHMSENSANTWVFSPRQVLLMGPRDFNGAKEELREQVVGLLGISAAASKLERGDDAFFDMEKGDVFSVPQNDDVNSVVRVGLGWTAFGCMDLDVSAVCVDQGGLNRVAVVDFSHLNAAGISHSGDNLTGEGAGDDEVITVNLAGVDSTVEKIFFTVSVYAFCGCCPWPMTSFLGVPIAHVHLYQGSSLQPMARFQANIGTYGAVNNFVAAALVRNQQSPSGWDFQASGRPVCLPLPCCNRGNSIPLSYFQGL